jgi:hypothetical protein
MRKIILAVFAFAFFSVLNASSVSACTCLLSPTAESLDSVVKKAYKNSSAVFVGEVLEIVQKPNVFFVEVKFAVEQKWNDRIEKTVAVTTGKGGGDCGYPFEVGKKYLVYASNGNNILRTNICTKTALAENNKDIAVLNKIKRQKIKSSPK